MENIMRLRPQISRFVSDLIRPLERKLNEQFVFGHREVVIHSLNLHPQSFFLATLQHGWIDITSARNRPLVYSRKGMSYIDYVWSERARLELKNIKRSKVFVLGSPFAHLSHQFFSSEKLRLNRKFELFENVVYFPSHSHHGWESDIEVRFSKLKEISKSINVCLYWLDFLKEDFAVLPVMKFHGPILEAERHSY